MVAYIELLRPAFPLARFTDVVHWCLQVKLYVIIDFVHVTIPWQPIKDHIQFAAGQY